MLLPVSTLKFAFRYRIPPTVAEVQRVPRRLDG